MNEELIRTFVRQWRHTCRTAIERAKSAETDLSRALWTGYASAYLDVLEVLEPLLGIEEVEHG